MARTSSAVLEDGAKGGAAAPANATARRKQIQSVVLLLFALGALSVVVRVADLSVYSSATTSTSASRAAGLAQMRSASRVATPLKAKSNASVVTEESPKMKAARLEQLAAMVEAVGVQRPAHQYDSKTREMCFRERDVGMLEAIRGSAKEFCGQASAADGALPKRSPSAATAVTLYRVRGGIKSAVLENVMVDLTDAEIFHPIKSMAEDGGSHDPRFKFNPRLVNCACKELADHYLAMSEPQRAHDHLWTPSVADIPDSEATPMSLLCAPKPESVFTDGSDVSTWDFVRHPDAPPNASATVVFEDPVIIIARRDDHNPFFQISYALNAWVMVQALGWDLARTRVLHFDAGYPSPIDALHQKLFSDDRPLMEAHQMMGKQLHFKNQVLVAPFELSGPMMQHLDDEEPCYDSEMLKKFRELSLTSQGITPTVVADLAVTKVRPFTVTIITRKPYDGRKLQRVWLNEDEVVGKMRAEYSGLNVEFRSIDYVLLSLEEQMRTTLESDLVIGMHGAGMVNVMWARPEAVIVEIFPKERFRWGYRNLCQFLGCHWHEFRGGEDLGDNPTPNTKDKNIPYDEWMAFFHPLFRDAYSVFDEKQRVLQHQLEGI